MKYIFHPLWCLTSTVYHKQSLSCGAYKNDTNVSYTKHRLVTYAAVRHSFQFWWIYLLWELMNVFPPALHFRSSEFCYIVRWCAAVWCCTALYADSHTSLRQRAAVYIMPLCSARWKVFCTALWKVHIHRSYYGVPHWTKARNAAVRVGLHST